MLIAPLIVLAAVASYVGGNGLGIWWFVPNPFQYIIAAAMHGSYVLRSPRTSLSISTARSAADVSMRDVMRVAFVTIV